MSPSVDMRLIGIMHGLTLIQMIHSSRREGLDGGAFCCFAAQDAQAAQVHIISGKHILHTLKQPSNLHTFRRSSTQSTSSPNTALIRYNCQLILEYRYIRSDTYSYVGVPLPI
ncbi:Protein of unknown function [Pyronema omphalodes CBS 100304]|uniref:Uncharacterized protein n=1 Tax=Pyronema omphalodes (strain CBS 100304) TaxID=1076935 RepID=U4LQN8_PYROM|nr:Protein of unknown function [Pyronema omphalodes CBS 100304]